MTVVGSGDHRYEVVEGWEQLPGGWEHKDVSGVATDSQDRVYLITRSQPRVIVYQKDGSFVASWGENEFTERTHGITVGPDDSVYCVDDGGHCVKKFTSDGKLLLTLGTGKPSDTGYDGSTVPSITHGGPPFNRPTNVAVAPNGELYVSDGYGNCRVHRFSADGELIQSWGTPGTGPGEFNLPHGIWVLPDERVLVADRENDRIQIFSPSGEFITQWLDVQRPTQLYARGDGLVYVSELQWMPGQSSFRNGKAEQRKPARISVFDEGGKVVSRLEELEAGMCASGSVGAPHSLAVDSEGSIYVGEVTYTFLVSRGHAPADCHMFQKFARV
ncbi:MAG: peptidyl-alpha-hydroxyglycine alpha-amidating lyase family protein [Chloroflexota bacterium]